MMTMWHERVYLSFKKARAETNNLLNKMGKVKDEQTKAVLYAHLISYLLCSMTENSEKSSSDEGLC